MIKRTYKILSPEEIEFIRVNSGKMTRIIMAKKLGCSQQKITENARWAGITIPAKNRHGFSKPKKAKLIQGDFFNVDEYKNWVLGFKLGRNY